MNIHRSPVKVGGSLSDLSSLRDRDADNLVTLRKRKQPESDLADTLADFRKELMKSFQDFFEIQNKSLSSLCEDVRQIKQEMSGMKLCNEKILQEQNKLKHEVSEIKTDNNLTKEKIEKLDRNLSQAQLTIAQLSSKLRDNDQQGRRNNLEFAGIPQQKSENLYNIIKNIATKVGFTLNPSDIDYIHRVRRFKQITPGKPSVAAAAATGDDGVPTSTDSTMIPNIIVRFCRRNIKMEFLSAVRARRGLTTVDAGLDGPSKPIFVNDHLAPYYKMLYSRTRALAKQNDYKYVWLRDCQINVRKNDTSRPIVILSENDLDKI